MHTPYTKLATPSTPPSADLADYVKADGAASTPPATDLLEHYGDISLASVRAAHQRLKSDPDYRQRDMPESALTDRERIALAEQRRSDRRASDREYERQAPIGCRLDGMAYSPTFKVLQLYAPPGDKPDMRRACRFAAKHWPEARHVVVMSGDRDEVNYRRAGSGWLARRPHTPDGPFGYIYGAP